VKLRARSTLAVVAGLSLAGCGGGLAPAAHDGLRSPASTIQTDHTPDDYSVVYAFQGQPNDGSCPIGNLFIDKAGDIFGVTCYGGTLNEGTVYELTPSGSSYVEARLHSFSSTVDGEFPTGGPLVDPSGSVFATVQYDGPGGEGTAVELEPNGNSFNETAVIPFGSSGYSGPNAPVTKLDGRLFTTVQAGGHRPPDDAGGIVELLPQHAKFHASYDFAGARDGATPTSGLVAGSDGDLYGVTEYGGTGGLGTVFKFAPRHGGGKESVLWNFHGLDGKEPVGSLVIDKDGAIYGVTRYGGVDDDGTVFKLSAAPGGYAHTILHNFGLGQDGAAPAAGMALKGDRLFGTAEVGGNPVCSPGCGIIFELTTSGKHYRIRHVFDAESGAFPLGGMIAWDGALYGTANASGYQSQTGSGLVFRFVP
jgi:uncharacterized repeat protein (TIGR03803 family)